MYNVLSPKKDRRHTFAITATLLYGVFKSLFLYDIIGRSRVADSPCISSSC